jgi:hypothetical protein
MHKQGGKNMTAKALPVPAQRSNARSPGAASGRFCRRLYRKPLRIQPSHAKKNMSSPLD